MSEYTLNQQDMGAAANFVHFSSAGRSKMLTLKMKMKKLKRNAFKKAVIMTEVFISKRLSKEAAEALLSWSKEERIPTQFKN